MMARSGNTTWESTGGHQWRCQGRTTGAGSYRTTSTAITAYLIPTRKDALGLCSQFGECTSMVAISSHGSCCCSLLLNQACQTFVTEDNWTRNVASGGCIWQLKYVCNIETPKQAIYVLYVCVRARMCGCACVLWHCDDDKPFVMVW